MAEITRYEKIRQILTSKLFVISILCLSALLLVYILLRDGASVANPSEGIRFTHGRPVQMKYAQNEATWNYNWDRNGTNSRIPGKVTARRTMILIRHGQYSSTGRLTPLGRKQADMTGRRLVEMGWIYDAMVHSTMIRAAETAGVIGKHLPRVPTGHDALLCEGGPTPPDPPVPTSQLPKLDYLHDMPRIDHAFRKYMHRAPPSQRNSTNQILVGHANVIKYFLLRTLQFPSAGWMRFFIPHGSISVITIDHDGTVSTGRIGDAGFMPVSMVTY